MSERPTLRDIEAQCEDKTGQYEAIGLFRERIGDEGYIIIHKDDVPKATRGEEWGYITDWIDGWNDCREKILNSG